ncbi:hypothetical protein SBV1_2850026 [Verrucomicrobia bacterium]|nr:hypothetical protein SBV1_2850026 [Verrucomicrobiota bacterium]
MPGKPTRKRGRIFILVRLPRAAFRPCDPSEIRKFCVRELSEGYLTGQAWAGRPYIVFRPSGALHFAR